MPMVTVILISSSAIETATPSSSATPPPNSTAPAYAAAETNPFGITDVGRSASPTLADIDGDGDLDLFIGNRGGNTRLFRNTAAPSSSDPAYAAAEINPFGITGVGRSASPTLTDIDRDGDLDVFIGNADGNTLFFRNTATPGSSTPAYAAAITNPFGITDVGRAASPTLTDIDGDGDLDLFIGNRDGNTLFFRNNAAPGSTTPAYTQERGPMVNPILSGFPMSASSQVLLLLILITTTTLISSSAMPVVTPSSSATRGLLLA